MTIAEQFEEFWNIYPKRVGKILAQRSYTAAIYYNGTNHEAIVNGVEAYKKHLVAKGTDIQFILSPAKWLQEGHWDDEYELNLPKAYDDPLRVRAGETMSQAKSRLERSGLKLVGG